MDVNFPKILKVVNLINIIFGSSHPIYNDNKFIQHLNKCRKIYRTILCFIVLFVLIQQIQMIYELPKEFSRFKKILNIIIFTSNYLIPISIWISTELLKNIILKMNENFFTIHEKLKSFDNDRSSRSINIQSFIFIFVVHLIIFLECKMNIFPLDFWYFVYFACIYITDWATIRFVIECFLNIKNFEILKKELQENFKEIENRKILINDAVSIFKKSHENSTYSKSIFSYQVNIYFTNKCKQIYFNY